MITIERIIIHDEHVEKSTKKYKREGNVYRMLKITPRKPGLGWENLDRLKRINRDVAKKLEKMK